MNLDIIIPTLNEKENLMSLIRYLIDNTSNSTKIFIIDSIKSNDDVQQLCNHSKVQYKRSKYAGRSKQMNEGAQMGDGTALMFLHADVRPPKNFEQLILDKLKNGYNAGFFSYKFDNSSFLLKINEYFTNFDGKFAGGGDQCQFFTRQLFEEYNGYRDDFIIMEDFEMINRLRQNKESYAIIREPAKVSSRKYINNSYLKVNLINLMTFIKYNNNVSQEDLKDFYSKSLNPW